MVVVSGGDHLKCKKKKEVKKLLCHAQNDLAADFC